MRKDRAFAGQGSYDNSYIYELFKFRNVLPQIFLEACFI